MNQLNTAYTVVVPAAGVGKRMQANCPKQYLKINQHTILEHTVKRLLSHPRIKNVVLVLSESDEYFPSTSIANLADVIRVNGGVERVNSVLNGLKSLSLDNNEWVLVHDAARPCLTHEDIDILILTCTTQNIGGILATPVRDTMKRAHDDLSIDKTVDRSTLWHALTPQMYKVVELKNAITSAQKKGLDITDESSAIEYAGLKSLLVEGRSDNLKITRPDDLILAEFILNKQNNEGVETAQ